MWLVCVCGWVWASLCVFVWFVCLCGLCACVWHDTHCIHAVAARCARSNGASAGGLQGLCLSVSLPLSLAAFLLFLFVLSRSNGTSGGRLQGSSLALSLSRARVRCLCLCLSSVASLKTRTYTFAREPLFIGPPPFHPTPFTTTTSSTVFPPGISRCGCNRIGTLYTCMHIYLCTYIYVCTYITELGPHSR